jgi:hypothetical protein
LKINELVVTDNKLKDFGGPGYKWSRAGYGPRAASYITLLYISIFGELERERPRRIPRSGREIIEMDRKDTGCADVDWFSLALDSVQ